MKTIALAANAVLFLTLGAETAVAQSGYDLFQQALVKERADGNVQEAIQLYQRIVREFADDRALAAKALVQMGRSYEKLGRPDAREAYERVLRDYADQTEPMAVATRRLAALRDNEPRNETTGFEEQQGIVFRQIEFDGLERTPSARLSPDGKRLLYGRVKRNAPSSINVMNLESGDDQVLIDSLPAYSGAFDWSPDGQQVVYTARQRELRVIGSSGGESRLLWSSPDEEIRIAPLDWSLDGRHILVALGSSSEWTIRLAILPSAGGEPRHLVSGKIDELVQHGQFSPDSKFVVGQRDVGGNIDVYVWAVDGSEEVRVTQHPAEDDRPVWSPDGKYLVFRSDRTKNHDLWAVPMAGARPGGGPFLIKRDLGGNTRLTDFTPAGQLTMLVLGGGSADLLALTVEPSAEGQRGDFVPFAKYPTEHFAPRWSPAGKRIAYTSRKGEIGWPSIFISSGSEQEDIEIPMPDHYVVNAEWARNGEHLIFPGWQRDGRVGIFRVSLHDHEIVPLHLEGRFGPRFRGAYANLNWLPIANKFMLQKIADSTSVQIYTMDKDGKELQLAVERVPTMSWLWPSPDGRHLAYRQGQRLELLAIDDGTSRVLAEAAEGERLAAPAWSPNGRHVAWQDSGQVKLHSTEGHAQRVLITVSGDLELVGTPRWSPDGTSVAYLVRDVSAGPAPREELWTISVHGGRSHKIAAAPSSHSLSRLEIWHPSRNVIFATGEVGSGRKGPFEHWVLENFLPKEDRTGHD